MGFYIEVTQTPNRSGFAAEDIPAGTLVYLSGGEAHLADASTHETVDGVADTPRRGEYIAEDMDDTSSFTYLADASAEEYATLSDNNAHLVPVGGGADGDYIKVRTIADTDATAPAITDGAIVGFVDATDVDAPANAAGYIVEEGYTYDGNADTTATTFSRVNDNFVAIGRVYRESHSDYDRPTRVVVNQKL